MSTEAVISDVVTPGKSTNTNDHHHNHNLFHSQQGISSDVLTSSSPDPVGLLSHHPKPPAIGMTPRRCPPKGLNVPGPGSYDIGKAASLTSSYHGGTVMTKRYFKATSRSGITNSSFMVSPGPGSYNPVAPISLKDGHTKHVSLGGPTHSVRDNTEDTPGPGRYTVPSSFSDVLTRPSTCKSTFGTASYRTNATLGSQRRQAPGPGAYVIPSTFPSIGSQKGSYMTSRFPSEPIPPGPGPAAYTIPTERGRVATMKGRLPHPLFESHAATDAFARMPTEVSKHRILMYKRSSG
eukprot:PhF_6_TR18729/c0_g1_i1/m.27361